MKTAEYSSTSLHDILAHKTVEELRTLAKAYRVKGYTKMNKAKLIDAVQVELLVPERIEEMLYVIDDSVWQLFQRAANAKGPIAVSKSSIPQYKALEELYLLRCNDNGSELLVYIPDEVQVLFDALVKNGFLEHKARFDLVNHYAAAAASFYGVISQDDFVDLFNQQNAQKTNVDEVFSILVRYIAVNVGGYCFWDEYLVCDEFEENDFDDIPDLLNEIGDKPRYIPEKKEFLRYADPDYFERTPQTAKLERYLFQQFKVNVEAAEEIVEEIHFAIAVEAGMQSLFEILDAYHIHPEKSQLRAILPLIVDMSNATRLWSNNGYTPNELSQMRAFRNHHQRREGARKIGRNEPCPCGSGKKYKKCCGR